MNADGRLARLETHLGTKLSGFHRTLRSINDTTTGNAMTTTETFADVLARKYSDDDLNVILQDWDHADPDQAVSMTLAAEVLRLRRIEAAMPQGEPVAWMYISVSGVPSTPYASESNCRRDAGMFGGSVRPLIFGHIATPQPSHGDAHDPRKNG